MQIEQLQSDFRAAKQESDDVRASLQRQLADAEATSRAEVRNAEARHAEAEAQLTRSAAAKLDAAVTEAEAAARQRAAEREREHEAAVARVADAAAAELRETTERLSSKVRSLLLSPTCVCFRGLADHMHPWGMPG